MCRNHLPGWQALWNDLEKDANVQFVSIAMDAQGQDRVKPYIEKAALKFPTVIDHEGTLWEQLGFNFVPLQILFDENGYEVLRTRGAPDAELTGRLKEAFAVTPPPVAKAGSWMGETPETATVVAARQLFAKGVSALQSGNSKKAAKLWEEALEKDPGNWLVRKQIWALENPDKFYAGEIDSGWQREKMKSGK